MQSCNFFLRDCKFCQQSHTAGRLGGSGARVRSSVISRSYRRRMIQKSASSISGRPKPPLIASRSRNTEGCPHFTQSPRMVEVTSRHWAHSKRFPTDGRCGGNVSFAAIPTRKCNRDSMPCSFAGVLRIGATWRLCGIYGFINSDLIILTERDSNPR